MDVLDGYFKERRDADLAELSELLEIPSISSLSEHKDDILRAAQWLAAKLKKIGMANANVMETRGHPVVYAEWLQAPGAPTVLIYGHYDVQPVDPLNLWETPPFEPDIRDGKIYARGACDDKGQTFMHVKAIQALMETEGKLPVNVKVLIEGEEEVGSPHLEPFVQEYKDMLAADLVVISDSAMWAPGVPALCYGLRGLAGLEVHIRGPKSDLHSGEYGGAVVNPLHVLVELLAGLREGQGRIKVEGFYDRVRELSAQERGRLAELPFDEADFQREVGVKALGGEAVYTVIERIGVRPTLEINGMWGGFQGEGTKTVLPSEAHAKITCRLVPDQDPNEIIDLIEAHLRKHCPESADLTIDRGHVANPWICPPDHPALQVGADALKAVYGNDPVFMRMGGSIPVVESFDRLLQAPVVLMGFGLPGENLHAPNEHFHLHNFDSGLRVLCRYWESLANQDAL